MAIRPETPTVTIDMVAVTEAINDIMVREKSPEYARVGLEQLAAVQLFIIQAAGEIIDPHWHGDEPLTLHDIGATLTAMAIVIRDHAGGSSNPRVYQTLIEACDNLATAARKAEEHRARVQGEQGNDDESIWDLGSNKVE